MVIYCIEGNIGSGKTTFLAKMKEKYSERFTFITEPVEEWKKIIDPETGKNKIELFYEDMKSHSFSFQIMAYITRISAIKEALENTPSKHIISERSIHTDRNVFAKMLREDGMISSTDYQIYMKCFESLVNNLPEIKYIYVRTNPELSLERIRERNRPGEEGITLEYIERIHRMHEQWLIPMIPDGQREQDNNQIQTNDANHMDKIFVIDGNINFQDTINYEKQIKQTYKFCSTPIDELVNTMRGYFG
jgi:deoxyadenosine/deoxycytidine kinase